MDAELGELEFDDGLVLPEGTISFSLFSEEYDPVGRGLLGNFPQAFSHIGLLYSIFTIPEAKAGR
jgi:hypothetical protein